MPSTFFISDLHLDSSRPGTTAALAGFLAGRAGCDALYILGDLFEAWVGDDDDAPLVGEVRQMLARFSEAGPELFIMQGNRDFLLGEAYCRSAGAELLPDPTVIDLYGEPTLLLHGDSLCTGDAEYQAFRKTAREPAWQAELLARPLAERRALAAQLRGMSREANSNKAEDIMDVAPAAVAQAMSEYSVRQMIHGHTHRPVRHAEPGGTRWVLGDWCEQGWAIEATPEGIRLNSFGI